MAEKFYSLSPYTFLNNNPLNTIDPTGALSITLTGQDAQDPDTYLPPNSHPPHHQNLLPSPSVYSIKSFDIVLDDSAFDLFFEKVKDEFIIIDKTTVEDIQINIDYYKNFEFDGVRIHMSIDLNGKTLHYSYVDL